MVETLRGGAARVCSILHRGSGGDPVGHKCLALGHGRHPSSDKATCGDPRRSPHSRSYGVGGLLRQRAAIN
jgi:hypothetical protein